MYLLCYVHIFGKINCFLENGKEKIMFWKLLSLNNKFNYLNSVIDGDENSKETFV